MSDSIEYADANSGLDFPRIPEHWDIKPLKRIAQITNSNVDKKTYEGQRSVLLCNYTDVYYNEAVTGQLSFMEATASEQEIQRYGLRFHDLVITKDSETPEDIGVASIIAEDIPNMVCGYHLSIIRAKKGYYPPFLKRVFQSLLTKAYFTVRANGLTRYSLGLDAIGELPMAVPPLGDQRAIAAFLDRKTAQIDALIAAYGRLLTLLEEKRQAVITQAVTKGLDLTVPMKDSGVEWLGEVPAHWSVLPIKYRSRIGNGSTPNKDDGRYWENGTFPWLTSGCVNRDEVMSAEHYVTEAALRECHLPIITPPAVLVGITGQGKTRGMAATLKIKATINQHIAFLKPTSKGVHVDFLRRFLDASYKWLRFDSEGVGSTKGAITCEQLAKTKIALPPLVEQESILDFIRNQTEMIERLQLKTQRSIDLLKEYRSALITAAVTGQIDVRKEVVSDA